LRFSFCGGSGVPGLDRDLLGDLAAGKRQGGSAEHAFSVGVGAGLGEGELVTVEQAGVDAMGHGAAADIVVVDGDRYATLDLVRPAGGILLVDDLQCGVIGVEPGQGLAVAGLDGGRSAGIVSVSIVVSPSVGLRAGLEHQVERRRQSHRQC
jgi:hypothetical protein